MFVEMISGSARRADELHRQIDRWVTDIAPGVGGWRGSTAGVAVDGTFVVGTVADDDDEKASWPGHDQWRNDTLALLDGERSCLTFDRVTLNKITGDVTSAGFVQFVVGRVRDPGEAEEYLREFDAAYAPLRPDCLGRLVARRDDGRYVCIFHFTSEAQAREAEAREVTPDLADLIARGQALSDGSGGYIDVPNPWTYQPSAEMESATRS